MIFEGKHFLQRQIIFGQMQSYNNQMQQQANLLTMFNKYWNQKTIPQRATDTPKFRKEIIKWIQLLKRYRDMVTIKDKKNINHNFQKMKRQLTQFKISQKIIKMRRFSNPKFAFNVYKYSQANLKDNYLIRFNQSKKNKIQRTIKLMLLEQDSEIVFRYQRLSENSNEIILMSPYNSNINIILGIHYQEISHKFIWIIKYLPLIFLNKDTETQFAEKIHYWAMIEGQNKFISRMFLILIFHQQLQYLITAQNQRTIQIKKKNQQVYLLVFNLVFKNTVSKIPLYCKCQIQLAQLTNFYLQLPQIYLKIIFRQNNCFINVKYANFQQFQFKSQANKNILVYYNLQIFLQKIVQLKLFLNNFKQQYNNVCFDFPIGITINNLIFHNTMIDHEIKQELQTFLIQNGVYSLINLQHKIILKIYPTICPLYCPNIHFPPQFYFLSSQNLKKHILFHYLLQSQKQKLYSPLIMLSYDNKSLNYTIKKINHISNLTNIIHSPNLSFTELNLHDHLFSIIIKLDHSFSNVVIKGNFQGYSYRTLDKLFSPEWKNYNQQRQQKKQSISVQKLFNNICFLSQTILNSQQQSIQKKKLSDKPTETFPLQILEFDRL